MHHSAEGRAEWQVPSWPVQGEYASTTNFVTDDPEPITNVSYVGGDIAGVALFSDGLERLALDFATKRAFTPFFNSMFKSLPDEASGRYRQLSRDLRTFLDGPPVTQRTDDDKTLIMARRA
jgi:protein phosphatase 2C-like protein